MGTLVLQNPLNPLAGFALSQVDGAIALYTSVVQNGGTSRLVKNLQWLLRLRGRAYSKMSRLANVSHSGPPGTEEPSDDEDIELIGWRTRLIERAGNGLQKATTISSTTPTAHFAQATPSPSTAVSQTIALALQQHFGPISTDKPAMIDQPSADSSSLIDSSTDQLLHQFWDPMMMQEVPESNDTWAISVGKPCHVLADASGNKLVGRGWINDQYPGDGCCGRLGKYLMHIV